MIKNKLYSTPPTLQTWSQKWLHNLNINKCCIASYGRLVDKSMRYTLVDHSNHNSQRCALERCDKVKDLGVWFVKRLSFREHIQDKINNAYMMLGIIKCNFRHQTITISTMIYNTMV